MIGMRMPAPVKIHKYWLPFEDPPSTGSITVDGDDAWFYLWTHGLNSIGQLSLRDSEAEFNHYFLSSGREERLIIEDGIYKLRMKYGRIGSGIAAYGGNLWYFEKEETMRMIRTGPDSGRGELIPVRQALCKMDAKTRRVTKYLFPSPGEMPQSLLPNRLELDQTGRRAWAANGNNAWVFDTATNKLKTITMEEIAEIRVQEHVHREPKHAFLDVALEPDGERGWFIDAHRTIEANGALYLFNTEDLSLLKYPLKGFRPFKADLAPDGRIWLTATSPVSVPVQPRHPPIELGYILSFDPSTNELTTYLIPRGFPHPEGILATYGEEVWFGFEGISRLDPKEAKGSKSVI
ncbi:MAG: hypothetical protein ACETVR_00730, partial [Candidatus Bathyarchaeia archaeon]